MPSYTLAAALLVATAAALTTTTSSQAEAPHQAPALTGQAYVTQPPKEPLAVKAQYFNGVTKKTYSSPTATYGTRFGFVDLAEAKSPRTDRARSRTNCGNRSLGDRRLNECQRTHSATPFVSFLYERGWRDSFKRSGFPGADDEFAEVEALFGDAPSGPGAARRAGRPARGLFTRRLAKAKHPDTRVIAADYSESMLVETKRRLDEADLSVELFRVDVAQLPFNSQSLSAVLHAALHCWVQLEKGLEEIRRVLKPGAPFFATTFLVGAMGTDSLPKAVASDQTQ